MEENVNKVEDEEEEIDLEEINKGDNEHLQEIENKETDNNEEGEELEKIEEKDDEEIESNQGEQKENESKNENRLEDKEGDEKIESQNEKQDKLLEIENNEESDQNLLKEKEELLEEYLELIEEQHKIESDELLEFIEEESDLLELEDNDFSELIELDDYDTLEDVCVELKNKLLKNETKELGKLIKILQQKSLDSLKKGIFFMLSLKDNIKQQNQLKVLLKNFPLIIKKLAILLSKYIQNENKNTLIIDSLNQILDVVISQSKIFQNINSITNIQNQNPKAEKEGDNTQETTKIEEENK